MVFYLLVGMCLAYEIHKIFDFRVFNQLSYLLINYRKQIKEKEKFYTTIIKISFIEICYYIILIIGAFGSQGLFFSSLFILAIISNSIMKKTNHKGFSIIYFIDIILSAIVLIFILANFYFFKMESIDFIKYLISLI